MSTEPHTRHVTGARPLSIASLLFVLVGCPGSLENPEDFVDPNAPCDAPATILGPRCATSNCHDAEDPISGLDLTPDEGLAGRVSGVAGADCTGLLADPDAPDQSLLLTKCQASNTCAARMPISGEKLTADEEQCLLEWLSSL
jgi:hypothetical protein